MMNSSGRWGVGASAALGFLCVALLAANFLLPYLSSPAPDSERETASGKLPGEAAPASAPTRETSATLPVGHQAEARGQGSVAARGGETELRPLLTTGTKEIPKSGIEKAALSDKKSDPTAPPSPDPVLNVRRASLVKPLGIVEKADGRVQAVIQDGEWVELVEEGQVLADNRRVVRVSAEGVEVAPPPPEAEPPVELARLAPGPPEPNSAKVRAPEPSQEAASAADNASPLRPTRREIRAVAAAEVEGSPPPAKLSEPRTDAERTKQPRQHVGEPLAQETMPEPEEAARPTPPAVTKFAWTKATQNPEIGAQNAPQPIGLVEWADGRTEAVVADGDFIAFANDERVLAEARQLPGMVPAAGAPSDGLMLQSNGALLLKEKEEDTAVLPSLGEPEHPPPQIEQAALAEPDAQARGQPEELAAANSRPPPFHSRDDGLWEAELPGLEDPANATTGRFDAGARTSPQALHSAQRALSRSVPDERHAGSSVPHKAPRIATSEVSSPLQMDVEGTRFIRPLGIVVRPDGRMQAVIADGEWVQLVEEGQRLSDGSVVVRVTWQVVELEPAAAGSDGGAARAGGTAVPNQHLTDQYLPAELLLFRAMQDNRTQSHE